MTARQLVTAPIEASGGSQSVSPAQSRRATDDSATPSTRLPPSRSVTRPRDGLLRSQGGRGQGDKEDLRSLKRHNSNLSDDNFSSTRADDIADQGVGILRAEGLPLPAPVALNSEIPRKWFRLKHLGSTTSPHLLTDRRLFAPQSSLRDDVRPVQICSSGHSGRRDQLVNPRPNRPSTPGKRLLRCAEGRTAKPPTGGTQMPEFTSYPAGTPSWVDHAAKDVAASNSFYSGVFGWEAEDQGEEMGHYTILRKGGKTVAGNMTVMMEGQPSAWVSYISVDDADAITDLAKKAGAAVFVEPMDVSDIGRMALFADPTGAAIGVWQPKTFKGAELVNEPGSFAWNELNTRDVPAAKAFYTEVFGWKANDMDMGEMSYTEWRLGDKPVAGMQVMPDMVPAEVPAHWLVYFAVGDTDATVSKAIGAGATTLAPPMDIPPGRFAVLSDPEGAAFAVIKTNPMGT